MRTEVFTAKTVEEAKAMAAEAFGVSAEELVFEVLEEKRGLFKKEARVQATYSEPEAAAEPAAAQPEPAVEPEPEIQPAAEAEPQPSAKAEPATATVTDEAASADAEPDLLTSAEIEPDEVQIAKAETAKAFVTKILEQMGLDSVSTTKFTERGVLISFDGEQSGAMIGRRGETLDALQYLASMLANRGDKEYYRITLDSCGYRTKRKKTLEELAQKLSKSALRTGRSVTLEPMNPYERRIIHAAVAQIEGVSSRSIGDEPFRKVIISSDRSRDYKHDGRDHGTRRNDRRSRTRDRKPYEPGSLKPMDLSTSFEKDYKRPKPEDEIHTGLYGKIEL